MKDAALALPRYLLVLVVVTAVLTLCIVLVTSGAGEGSTATFLSSLEASILPSVVVSLFLASFYVPRSTGARFLTMLLLVAVSSSALVSGFLLTEELCGACEKPAVRFPFEGGEIQRIRTGAIFSTSVDSLDSRIDGLVVLSYRGSERLLEDPEGSGPMDVTFFSEAYYSPESDLLNASGVAIRVSPEDPVTTPLITPPAFLGRLFAEIATLRAHLAQVRSEPFPRYLITIVAVCAFATGSLLFSHLSRWKLANFVLSIFMFRLVFLSYDLFSGDLVTSLFQPVRSEFVLDQLPSFIFLAVAVLFIAMDLVFLKEER